MKSYIRYQQHPGRMISPARYPLFRAKIGYLYRTHGRILSYAYALQDPACRDGAMLRLPPQSFTDVYISSMMREIRNDTDQEAAAVYFDPYTGRYLVIGSKQLYLDARRVFGSVGKPLYLEEETPFGFDAEAYGTYTDPAEMSLTFDDYFVPDVTGVTVADCMTAPVWDNKPAPWQCAMDFFDRYYESMLLQIRKPAPDAMTTLLAMTVRAKNHGLLARLFALMPQILRRFCPTLREDAKFSAFSLPSPDGRTDPPKIFNLFQYTMLMGDPDTMQTLFRFYERPKELSEFLHHPLYYPLGFYHVRAGNTAALRMLLSHGYSPDSTDSSDSRITLVSVSCICQRPAMTAMLTSAGCSPEKTDSSGKCALDYAAAVNAPGCLCELLDALEPAHGKETAAALAARVPLGSDNQALLGVLETYLHA